MAYQVYLGDVLFPVAPSKIKMKINGQNKTMNLINGEEINVLNPAGLTDVDFDVLLPCMKYPFAEYEGGFDAPDYFLDELEQMKRNKRPVRFVAIRESPAGDSFFDTNMSVSLEDYSISEDVKEGLDVVVSVSLKKYVHYGVQRVKIEEKRPVEAEVLVSIEEDREASEAPALSTYPVKPGDRLWNIAKQYLGNGERYMEIYELNRDKIQNPNRIAPGMVLSMPV